MPSACSCYLLLLLAKGFDRLAALRANSSSKRFKMGAQEVNDWTLKPPEMPCCS